MIEMRYYSYNLIMRTQLMK